MARIPSCPDGTDSKSCYRLFLRHWKPSDNIGGEKRAKRNKPEKQMTKTAIKDVAYLGTQREHRKLDV